MIARSITYFLFGGALSSAWWMAGLGWKPESFRRSPWEIPAGLLTAIALLHCIFWIAANWTKKP